MFSKLHQRLGTAGLVVAVVALAAALAGTALAAAGLNSTQKKEVKKIAKKYAGKPGAPGAQGPPGPQGSAGSNGKNGTDGKNGADGQPGAKGDPGAGVIAAELAKGPTEPCGVAGGYSFEVEGSGEPHHVCNGAASAGGSGVLQPGEEETGVWSLFVPTEFTNGYWSIQYPRPLPQLPKKAFLKTGTPTSECPGSWDNPKANPETTQPVLCVYPKPDMPLPAAFPSSELSLTSGVVYKWVVDEETERQVYGSWAAKVPSLP